MYLLFSYSFTISGQKIIPSRSDLGSVLIDTHDLSLHIIILQVFWKRLYKTTSGTDRGTLCQLRKLINRRNVTNALKKNVNASEDF